MVFIKFILELKRGFLMETATLLLFAAALFCCVLFNFPILYALVFGYFLFCFYGLQKGKKPQELLKMSLTGIKTVKNILIVFLLIGMITALWRAAGTIPAIISDSFGLMLPSFFLVITFLLNCLVSFLTGTAFGSAATMGVITMAIGNAMGLDPAFLGGAILSGVYFGDRCSPMSTSALLVSELTKTNLFTNIRKMFFTSIVPFSISCILYIFLGFTKNSESNSIGIKEIFETNFNLSFLTLIPAILILVLSCFKISVKITMSLSILSAVGIAFWIQGLEPTQLFHLLIFGYHAQDPVLAKLIDGGGILSMVNVTAIVCLSSCYAGIFNGTGLLINLKENIKKLGQKISPYGSLLCTSIGTSMIACNQTLAIMLTHQLCNEMISDHEEMAINLENTVVVLAPLIPWSIAGGVPLAAVGAPQISLLFAFYLYLIPLWNFFKTTYKKRTN
jgi:NhaC family Na+:H+ antiporter